MAAIAGCTGSDTEPVPTEQRWSQHGYDAANTRYAPDVNGPTDDPSTAWEYAVPTFQPIVGDAVFLVAGADGCHAVDPDTGERLWRDDGNYALSTPTVADDTLYLSEHGGVRAVADDGGLDVLGRRLRYERWAGGPVRPDSPLTVAADVLVAGFGGIRDGTLAGVNAEDGTERWTVPVETTIEGAPAVGGEVVVAADRAAPLPGETTDTLAYGVSVDDGEVLWTHDFGTSDEVGVNWRAAPVAGDGLGYVPTTRTLAALDLATGEEHWTYDEEIAVSPALVGDRLLVCLPTGELLALDAATGEKRWRVDVDDAWLHAPAAAGKTVYTATEDGTIHGWSLDGETVFRLSLDGPIHSPPAISDGRLYVSTDDALYAIE